MPQDGGTSLASDLTAETLLFSLQRHVERQFGPVDTEKLVHAMHGALNPPTKHDFFDYEDILSINQPETTLLIRYLRWRMFLRPEMMSRRLKILAEIALGRVTSARETSMEVIRPLVYEVATLPGYIEQRGKLSGKIRRIYSLLHSRLHHKSQTENEHMSSRAWSEDCRR